jgi:hypothetical protein
MVDWICRHANFDPKKEVRYSPARCMDARKAVNYGGDVFFCWRMSCHQSRASPLSGLLETLQ